MSGPHCEKCGEYFLECFCKCQREIREENRKEIMRAEKLIDENEKFLQEIKCQDLKNQ
jgi:hypothetical protein